MKQESPKTIIIGGGPAGASAAIYLARFFHNVTLIDAPKEVAGRTAMATHLENYLGNDEPVSGEAFMERVNKQLHNFGITPIREKVTKVAKAHDGTFTVTTDKPKTYHADFVIVAVGLSDNMPEIDGLDPYYEHAIFHCLTCDWYWNKDKKATVVTNDDRGLETAIMIQTLHRPPALSVVPAKFNPTFSPELLDKAQALGIMVSSSPLKKLEGKDGYLKAIELEDGMRIETQVLFTKLGHTRFDQFLEEGGISVAREEDEDFIMVDFKTFETSVDNLFAVGPCNAGPDQAIIAGGQGALAALEIHRRILERLGL